MAVVGRESAFTLLEDAGVAPFIAALKEEEGAGAMQVRARQAEEGVESGGGGVVNTSPNYTKTNDNERSTGRGVSCKR